MCVIDYWVGIIFLSNMYLVLMVLSPTWFIFIPAILFSQTSKNNIYFQRFHPLEETYMLHYLAQIKGINN